MFVRHPILDHGHVTLIDYMGTDEAIEQAARISFNSEGRTPDDTRNLLRYMFRHRHTSPTEQCQLRLHVKLPIFVERQWARHRTAKWNEASARYQKLPEEAYMPEADQVCYQSTENKQGRAGRVEMQYNDWFRDTLTAANEEAFNVYQQAAEDGVALETARLALPVNTYTEKIWCLDLHNLFHFLSLRMDSHAQWEIRQYANIIGSIVAAWAPISYQAFMDYEFDARRFSAIEMDALREALNDDRALATALSSARSRGLKGRELAEFQAKLKSQSKE
jgi:thymidylate synthase (FAD)